MSTAKLTKNLITQQRFAKIAGLGEVVFHADDLANLWRIQNKNTLHTTLTRYVQAGLLNRIYRGFYSIIPLDKINPFLIGVKALHGYAYVTTETILARAGAILQDIGKITLAGGNSRQFSIGEWNFRSRKLKDKFLFNPEGISSEQGILTASPERAAADMLYFNPNFYFDNRKVLDWKKVKELQKKIGYTKEN